MRLRLLLLVIISIVQTAPPESGLWLAGPKNSFYLIGRGTQSWGEAREYCLARNADLVSVDDEDKLTWLLAHFMPSPRRPFDVIQVGLFSVATNWLWLNGHLLSTDVKVNASEGQQCGALRVMDATWTGVDCEEAMAARFVCERNGEKHIEQQKTENGLWNRFEALLDYLGVGLSRTSTEAPKVNSTQLPANLEDPGKLADDIEHAEKLLEQEGSGKSAEEGFLSVQEEGSGEGSGEELLHEGSGIEKKTNNEGKEDKGDEIERDFNTDGALEALAADAPRKEEDVDCTTTTTNSLPSTDEGDEHLLEALKMFLARASHSDLQRLVEDDSLPLMDRLQRGVTEANAREFAAVQSTDEQLGEEQRTMLFDELSKALVPDEKRRTAALAALEMATNDEGF